MNKLKINTSKIFSENIEEIHKSMSMNYLDSILHYCDVNNVEYETVKKLISEELKEKLRIDAENLNFLPKTPRLPF